MRREQPGGSTPTLLAALLRLLMLLPPQLVAAGWVEVAFAPPGELELLPLDAYTPISWTQRQIERMRRRALLQQRVESMPSSGGGSGGGSGSQLPICELMLAYRVVDLGTTNFSSIITLTNHRELDLSHWQVVWRYSDYRRVLLTSTDGAIQLSPGSPSGAPVRLVDTFQNDGIPGGGGTYSFLAAAAFVGQPLPFGGKQSLGIEAVNINGMQCSLASGGSMQYSQCLADSMLAGDSAQLGQADGPAIVLVDSIGGDSGSTSSSSSSGACWAHYCCGVVLVDTSAPPPVASPPPRLPASPPAASLPPAPELPPPLLVGSPAVAPKPAISLPAPTEVGSGSSAGSSSRSSSSVIVPAAAGGGSAAALLAAVGVLLLFRRQRRRSRPLLSPFTDGEAVLSGKAVSGSTGEEKGCPVSGTEGGSSLPAVASLLGGSPTLSSILSPAAMMLCQQGSGATVVPAVSDVPPLAAAEEPGSQVTVTPSILGAVAPASSHVDNPVAAGSRSSARSGGSGGSSDSGSKGGGGGSGGSVDLVQDVVLHEQLGSGAFGTVYRGSWRGKPVAVKVMQTSCGARSRELESFKQEARVLAGLRHPNIVSLLAACTVPPNICIIEELAEGGSLHQRLHGLPGACRCRSPLPYGQLLAVAADVAEAMCYLHPHIVHRDLKSQNVLLDAQGRAKVCDFGIAKFKDRTFVSTVGAQAGTPAYMAPEMFDGAPVSEKVDVFSYAVMCWEMLTGEVPWQELQTPMQIIFQVGVMHQRLPLPDSCPVFLSQLIEECWAEEPSQRPGFPAILQRLHAELARVAADVALQERRTACHSTASETDVSLAPGRAWRAAGASSRGSCGAESV